MKWAIINQHIAEHPKTLTLVRLLSCSQCEAVGILVCLWLWASAGVSADQRSLCTTPEDVAAAIQCDVQPGQLWDSLIKAGWLEPGTGDGHYIMNGYDHQLETHLFWSMGD